MSISFNVSNEGLLVIEQEQHDGTVSVTRHEKHYGKETYHIPNVDFVMLLNLYKFVKDNDIRNDFINPNGKNNDEAQRTSHWEDYDPMGVNYPTKCKCASCGYVDTFEHKYCADCGAKMTNAFILGKEDK